MAGKVDEARTEAPDVVAEQQESSQSKQRKRQSQREEQNSRRSFMKGLAAAGLGMAVLSQAPQLARAKPYYAAANLSDDQLINMLRQMLQIRWYDRTVGDRQASDPEFRGYMHGSPGHEAIAVGVCANLTREDWIQGYHRSHHHAIAKGADINGLAAEITYKATGTNKGYGGSMHLLQRDVGMLGEDGIVGPGGVIGAGAAYGLLTQGNNRVAVTFGGDAHLTSPFFGTALHNAKKYNLPFIYVVERNGYQTSHPTVGPVWLDEVPAGRNTAQTYLTSMTSVAEGYEVPAYEVDGMSVTEVYSTVKEAVDRARSGGGPSFIQANCYRFYDHFGVNGVIPGEFGAFGLSYRSDRETRHFMSRDPVPNFRQSLISWEVLTEESANALEAEVKQEIATAFDFADASPIPDPRGGIENVYTSGPVLPRQLPDTPLFIAGWNEGQPTNANHPSFAIGKAPNSKVVITES